MVRLADRKGEAESLLVERAFEREEAGHALQQHEPNKTEPNAAR
jgi:hypothetical protein